MRWAGATFGIGSMVALMGVWACVGDEQTGAVGPGATDGGATDGSSGGASSSDGGDSEAPLRTCDAGAPPGFGLFDTGHFKLWLSIEHASEAPDLNFAPSGVGSNVPVAGHWTVGDDTVGWFNPTQPPSYSLLAKNNEDPPALNFYYGPDGVNVPVTGDWDGDGTTTIGVYLPSENKFLLANHNAKVNADLIFSYGSVTNGRPVAGDWDGDGKDGVGVFDPADGRILLKNTPTDGVADVVIQTGHKGDDLYPLAANWNGCGVRVALYARSSGIVTYFETNATGAAEHTFKTSGGASATPLVGQWKH